MFNEPKAYLFFLLMSMFVVVAVTAVLYLFAILELAIFIFSIISIGRI